LGQAVVATGGSGLLARSAAVRRGVNVVIFRGVCSGDELQIVDAAKLDQLGVKLKA
jgi:hypothetical protein